MTHLDHLEARSVHILREAYAAFNRLCMLWSIGKDSTVLLHLARKAFLGHVPFPLMHIDTSFKIPEMIAFRDRLARDLKLRVIVGRNDRALAARQTFPDGTHDRLRCCGALKTAALGATLDGTGPRLLFDPALGAYVDDPDRAPYTGVIVGVRADEEGSRSKERYFSPRGVEQAWNVAGQPPEFWNLFKTDFAPGTHVRIHPLLDWTELDIWAYIARERIEVVSLYFDDGTGHRYRSLGCAPCTQRIASTARTVADIVAELSSGQLRGTAERAGRAQDALDDGGLEALRRAGYM